MKTLKHNIVIMKMKSITAIVAFSIAFGFSTLFAGLFVVPNPAGEEISALLRQDIANARIRDENYQSATSSFEIAKTVDNYVVESQLIDDTNLPSDFRSAWQAHKEAWRAHANFLARVNCLKKRMSEEQLAQISTEQNYQITETWLQVLKFGNKYGAVIPFEAY